jgi:hypothetical protein
MMELTHLGWSQEGVFRRYLGHLNIGDILRVSWGNSVTLELFHSDISCAEYEENNYIETSILRFPRGALKKKDGCGGLFKIWFVRFEVFTAMTMKNAVLWNATPCGSCRNQRFGGTYHFHHQDRTNQRPGNVSNK